MEKVIILIITGIAILLTSYVPIIINDIAKKSNIKLKNKLMNIATFSYVLGITILLIELSIVCINTYRH